MQGSYKHIDRIVLTFVLLGFLLLVTFSALVLIKNKTFTNRVYYETSLESANGLASNPPIFFKGFEIGRFDDFELLSETNEIRVKFYIYEDYAHKIIKFAVISRIESALLGISNEYELLLPHLGSKLQTEILHEGDLVPFISSDLGQVYAQKGQIKQKLNSIDSVLSNVNDVLVNLQKESNSDTSQIFIVLQKFSKIADSLVTLTQEAETSQIIPDVKKIILDLQAVIATSGATFNNTKTTIAHVDRLLINANKVAQHVDQLLINYEDPSEIIATVTGNKIPDTIGKVDRNLFYLEGVLKEIHLQREQLGAAIISLNKTLSSLDKTLEGVNNNPLIKDGIESDQGSGLSIEVNEN
jgi:ABC-type transporter Mla subunit MlaD